MTTMGNKTETTPEEITEKNNEEIRDTVADNFEEKYERLKTTIKQEQLRYNQLQSEFETCQNRELSLQNELVQLRTHLENIRDSYKAQAIKTNEHSKYLESKLQQVVAMNMSSSSLFRLASISEKEQAESLRGQAWFIAQRREDVQGKITAAEGEVARQAATLKNLQCVLERLKEDEKHNGDSRRIEMCVKFEAAHQKHNELSREISSLKSQLKEAKEGLSAVSRMEIDIESQWPTVSVV